METQTARSSPEQPVPYHRSIPREVSLRLQQGQRLHVIAAVCGVSFSQVLLWCRRLCMRPAVQRAGHGHARRLEAEELLRQGRSVAEVARMVGAPETSVQRWSDRLFPNRRRDSKTDAGGHPGRKRAERLLRETDLNDSQIARAVRASREAVRQWRLQLRRRE